MSMGRFEYYLMVSTVFGYMLYNLILNLDKIAFFYKVFGWKTFALLGLLYSFTALIGYYLGKSLRARKA